MPNKRRRVRVRRSAVLKVLAVVGVVLFVLIDIVLIASAVMRINDAESGANGPIPSFAIPDVPTPTPEPTGPPAAVASQNRYISTVDGVTLWRSSLGSCDGSDAVIEYSTNGGSNWTLLVTTEMRARQVLALEVIDEDTIWVVARAGDSCAVSGFASFTAGEFWEPRPEALTLLRYLDRETPDVVHLQGQALTAPCPTPFHSQSKDGATNVVCPDAVAEWSGGTSWASLEVPGLLTAAPTPGTQTLAVWGAEGCEGVSIQVAQSPLGTEEPVRAGCIPAETKPAEVALARIGTSVWAWVDDRFLASGDGGASW